MPVSEKELLLKAAQGDHDATYRLITETYSESLRKLVKQHYPMADKTKIDEIFSDFFMFMIEPNASGLLRLRNINEGGSPKSYIASAMRNWLNDRHAIDKRVQIVGSAPDEGRTGESEGDNPGPRRGPAGSGDEYDPQEIQAPEMKELMIESIFESFEHIDKLPPRDRYILLTFLIGERFRGEGRPLKLRNALGEQLNMNVSTLYNNYADNKRILSDIAKEILRRALMN